MRKFFVFLSVLFLFSAKLFSEQPFFLQNWIIPDDFVWSNDESIPYDPVRRFSQRMSSSYENSYITFNNRVRSNVDFPPYFEENNLLNWNKTYEEIIEAFKDNPLFFTFEYVYPYHHPEKPSDEIEFLDIIRIVCRQENHFELEIYFPHTRTLEERKKQKGSYCYLYYFKDGLNKKNLHRPQKETFEKEYKKLWDKNSADEKKIIALSYYILREYNYHPVKYDCTLLYNNSIADPAATLKATYDIASKKELIDYIQDVGPNRHSVIYDGLKRDLQEYPDKEPVEIGFEKSYTVPQISRLFFVKDMQESIGKHGIRIFEKLTHLFLLRLGVGAGYITREESVEYGLPIADSILKEYVSYKDMTAHFAASESFIGVSSSHIGSWPVRVMKNYNALPLFFPVEEISFDGSEADAELLFDDAYYKPEGEATWWCKIQSEYQNKNGKELSAVKYELSKYEHLTCLESLIQKIKPVKYNAAKNSDASAFYNKNYKEIWEKLPENEKYAIAFSSNLFELNRQYQLDFDGKVVLSDDSSDPKDLLKNSWSIENYEQLVEMFKSLEDYGHSGAYKSLTELLDKYPDKSPLEIASLESLSILDTTRLHFVRDTRELLGSHGIEAWDEGREITILRWGIASGYISSDEAMDLMEPVIKRIRENYYNFEDYISHYILGRQFYALYDGGYEKLGEKAKAACYSARAYIPFEFLMFTSQNADSEKKLTYADCIFTPSEAFTKWERVMTLYRQNASKETIELIKYFEKEMPECRNIVFYWHITLLNHFAQYGELVEFTEENMPYIESLAKDGEVYSNSLYYYINALNQVFNPEQALLTYRSLPEELQGNVYLYYQYAYANYLMTNLSIEQKEMDFYRNRASAAFKLLKEYDCNIGPQMDGWLLSLEGKSDGAEQALKEISEDSETYFDDMLAYFDELLEKNQPEVIVSMYKTLPQNLQNDERFYYDYGYANYLMAFKCVTIIEKDIYNSRAADVFLRLKARGFVLEESLNCWLSLQ